MWWQHQFSMFNVPDVSMAVGLMLLKENHDASIPVKSRGGRIVSALQAKFLGCWGSGLTNASNTVIPINLRYEI
jgi:hypothetical protein